MKRSMFTDLLGAAHMKARNSGAVSVVHPPEGWLTPRDVSTPAMFFRI